MSWPKDVVEKAMVACGRHCALCHKFAGGKMELHHIVQKKDGGPYSFENAIPLCFDCHAEAGHYNVQHPKGTKFTEGELRAHRDNWYRRMENYSTPTITPDHVALDRGTFRKIKELLPAKGSISFLRDNNFAGFAFRKENLDQLYEFFHTVDRDPNFEFLDPTLEGLRSQLFKNVDEFTDIISTETYPVDGRSYLQTVPPEWEHTDPKRFDEVVKKIRDAARSVCKSYDDFVREGRRRLAVE